MQQVLSLIFCRGHLWPIHHLPNWARMPWIEQTSFSSLLPKLNSSWPRLLTSHLHAKALAPALMKSKAKVGNRCLRAPQHFTRAKMESGFGGPKDLASPSSLGVKNLVSGRVETTAGSDLV